MTTDAFADVDPHHPGIVVAVEPKRFDNRKRFDRENTDLRATREWAKDLSSFSWTNLILDPDILGERTYHFLLVEARQGRLPSDHIYAAIRDKDHLLKAMQAHVRGVIVESPSALQNLRGALQRVNAAQEHISWVRELYHLEPLQKIPVLAYHHGEGKNGLDELLRLKEEGLVSGCVDATYEGTILKEHSLENASLDMLAVREKPMSWSAWRSGARPIVRVRDPATMLKYATLGDLWLQYGGKSCEEPSTPLVSSVDL